MTTPLDTKLAPNFTFGELTATGNLRFVDVNRRAAEHFLKPLTELAEMAQVVRNKFGPVVIHSGFRCASLNTHVGGSATSQHCKGEAIDFHCTKASLTEVFDWIRKESKLEFGQLILEGARPEAPTWIHLSLGHPWRPKASSGQAMTYNKQDNKYVVVRD